MKQLTSIGLFLITLIVSSTAYAEVYKIQVKQHAQNVYISQHGYIITTQNCTEVLPQFEDAVIIYPNDKFTRVHTLIFTNSHRDGICTVTGVVKKNEETPLASDT